MLASRTSWVRRAVWVALASAAFALGCGPKHSDSSGDPGTGSAGGRDAGARAAGGQGGSGSRGTAGATGGSTGPAGTGGVAGVFGRGGRAGNTGSGGVPLFDASMVPPAPSQCPRDPQGARCIAGATCTLGGGDDAGAENLCHCISSRWNCPGLPAPDAAPPPVDTRVPLFDTRVPLLDTRPPDAPADGARTTDTAPPRNDGAVDATADARDGRAGG